MTFYSDKVENFLAGASINYDHSGNETTTTFSAADQSSISGSKSSLLTLTNSDPLFSSLREWLHCRSQCMPDEEVLNESKLDLVDTGLQFVEMAASALETVILNKEDLRHCFKVPLTANVLPLHYNQHK
jgi:hypothetical protein